MRETNVPPKTKEREMVFLGILGWREIITCSVGMIVGAVFGGVIAGTILRSVPSFGVIFLFICVLIGLCFGTFFAFAKRKGLPYLEYKKLKKKIENRKNILLK